MILAVVDGIFCNCVEKPDKVGTSTEFEPVTSDSDAREPVNPDSDAML